MVNVLLVDDHELVRTGIALLLAANDEIEVVGVVGCGEDAVKKVDTLKPNVVLMDINMPGIGGIEASRRITQKHPEVKIIALSALSDGPVPQQLLISGVQGYISKSCSVTELIGAVMAVHGGKRYLSSDVASGMALSHLPGMSTGSPFEQLSNREMQIVILTLQGKNVAQIAELLAISPKTVSTYRYRLYAKLDVRNDVELVRLSVKHKLDTDTL